MASTGSTLVVDVVPSVATTAMGRTPAATSSSIASRSASTLIRNSSSVGMGRTPDRPNPSVIPALAMLEWASSEA